MPATLEDVRAEFAAGKHSRALRHVWDLVLSAYKSKSLRDLTDVRDFASHMSASLSGKDRDQADQLVRYAQACIDSVERGDEQPSVWQRLLFGSGTRSANRKCPDCAETIKAAARKCRYCGHTFDAAPSKDL